MRKLWPTTVKPVPSGLRCEDLYVPANQAVFQSMVALDQEGEPIDVITLEARLKSRDELISDIIGLLLSPATNIVGALQSPGSNLVGAIQAIAEKAEVEE